MRGGPTRRRYRAKNWRKDKVVVLIDNEAVGFQGVAGQVHEAAPFGLDIESAALSIEQGL